MGDYDYVPDVIRDLGGKVVSWSPNPRANLSSVPQPMTESYFWGYGNPVSATIGCQRANSSTCPAGKSDWLPKAPVVQLANSGNKSIPLTWLRLAKLVDNGVAAPVITQGSGGLVSLGNTTDL